MSIQSQIDRIKGETKSQSDIIEQIKSALVGKVAGGNSSSNGSGSGIIDVAELPTSGIDENAVYRLTESIQTEKTEVYLVVYLNGDVVTLTSQQYLASIGVSTIPHIYVVDELSNMLETDVQTFSAIHIYILKSDGIAYAYAPAYGGIITMGLFGFQAMGYDKGFTENIYAETEFGVYTTIENIKEVVRYFIRENGEWKEVTAYNNALNPHGFTFIEVLAGDVTTRLSAVNDVITQECTEISASWFKKRNGDYVDTIRVYLFSHCPFINVTIPSCIRFIERNSFFNCQNLTTVTFEGTPAQISDDIFDQCDNLTTINVPWSEGVVEGAPWKATNATINYNYTGE